MLETAYPEIEVYKIDDVGNIDKWSKNLDRQIDLLTGPYQRVILYGSRDSFIEHYTGKYPTETLTPVFQESSRNIRYFAGINSKNSQEFREGVLDGHYETDGGNRNRIYTSSPPMIETLNMLAATMAEMTVFPRAVGRMTNVFLSEAESAIFFW
jgi:hypothetical protein